jgi:hypothetical protein
MTDKTKQEMTPEEFVERYKTMRYTRSGERSDKDELASDLRSVIRGELIRFCHKEIPAEWLGDEVVVVDRFLNNNQRDERDENNRSKSTH